MATNEKKQTEPQNAKGKDQKTKPFKAKSSATTANQPQTEEVHETGALETVFMRNNFYRDNYRRTMVMCLVLLLIVASLIGYLYFLHINRPTPTYFATTHDGKLIKMIPLDQPNHSVNALLQWATEAATASYNYNFVNYREALQAVRTYYTPTGYQHLIQALKDSRNLEAIREKKLVASSVPTGAPIILKEGVMNNQSRYAWQVQIPMKVTYQSSNELIPQDIVITMLITRISTLESPTGIGIAQFIVREGRLR
jgi:intracellular multiplication protein IcmL